MSRALLRRLVHGLTATALLSCDPALKENPGSAPEIAEGTGQAAAHHAANPVPIVRAPTDDVRA